MKANASKNAKVSPITYNKEEGDFVEIRPGRKLRIIRINIVHVEQPGVVENGVVTSNSEHARIGSGKSRKTFHGRKDDISAPIAVKEIDEETEEIPPKFRVNTKLIYESALTVRSDRLNASMCSRLDSFDAAPPVHVPIQPEKSTIFFLHGVGGCADIWRYQINYFKPKGFRIIAPDLIGHGASPAPRDPSAYKFNEISEDILRIFDRYRSETNIVIGHSYGSSFATVVARERKLYIHKLVLIGGGAPIPLYPECGIFSFPICCLAGCRSLLNSAFRRNAFATMGIQQEDFENSFGAPTYVLKYMMNGQVWLEGGMEYHVWIDVDTMIIHGLKDQLIPLEEAVLMKKTIANSQLQVVDAASHMVMLEVPEKVNEFLDAFLSKMIVLTRAETPRENSVAETMQQTQLDSNAVEDRNSAVPQRQESGAFASTPVQSIPAPSENPT